MADWLNGAPEAARDYLNGDIDRDGAVQWLVDYALSSPERARFMTLEGSRMRPSLR